MIKNNTGIWSDLAQSFAIFASLSDPNAYWDPIYADRGVIFGGPDPKTMTELERRQLKTLGWEQLEDQWTYHL